MRCVAPIQNHPRNTSLENRSKSQANVQYFVNHKEEVKNSEDYVHCIEDGIRANVVLELVDEQEDCTFKEEVEDDGSIEQGLL